MNADTLTIYAISDSRPPDAWSSEWALLNGDRIIGSDVPDGFIEVDEETYLDVQRAQGSAMQRRVEEGDYEQRLAKSTQRKELIATGLTSQQARILAPDPENDYSIDDA